MTAAIEVRGLLKVYKLVASGIDDAVLGARRETGAGAERVNGHFRLEARDPRRAPRGRFSRPGRRARSRPG